MQFLRTFFWVLVLAALVIFTAFNWNPVEVQIWTNLVVETRVPALVIAAFLLGLVPTWLLHRGTKWRLKRRIAQLETAARAQHTPATRTSDFSPATPSYTPPPAPLP